MIFDLTLTISGLSIITDDFHFGLVMSKLTLTASGPSLTILNVQFGLVLSNCCDGGLDPSFALSLSLSFAPLPFPLSFPLASFFESLGGDGARSFCATF